MPSQYHVPQKLDAALSLLSRAGLKAIAGGTDLLVTMDKPASTGFVDLSRVDELKSISQDADGWALGAALKWSDITRADLPEAFDCLKQAAREVGSIQIQNAGTIGGNLCNASPAADGAPALLALDASVELVSAARGVRRLPLSEFLLGVRRTALQPDELMTRVLIPRMPDTARSAFLKLGSRRYMVISIAMVAVMLDCDPSGRIRMVRVAVGSCAPVAERQPLLESAMIGLRVAEVEVRPEHLSRLSPIDDVRGSAEYRIEAVAELCTRAIRKAGGIDHER